MQPSSPDIPFSEEELSLLDRYYAGLADAQESLRARRLIERTPREQLFAHATYRELLGSAPSLPQDAVRERLLTLQKLLFSTTLEQDRQNSRHGYRRRIFAGARPRGDFKAHPPRRGAWFVTTGVAVAVLALVTVWHTFQGRTISAVPVSTYVTGNGERANITLPDGNTVALDVASRLEVPANYLSGNHTLRLIGEGMFSVQHHMRAPFTVIAGVTATRVLGTSFLVRHYATDLAALIAVRDGKVEVQAGTGHAVTLTAAQQVAIDRAGAIHTQPADAAQFGFVTGVLTLTGGPLIDALPELNRWYDADIRLGDPALATRRLTGEYPAGSLADLTEFLEGTGNIRVVREGRVLTLYRR